MKGPELIRLEAIDGMSQKDIVELYRDHVSPGIAANLRILGWDRIKVVRAEGLYLHTECGRRILDFTASNNVMNHGHNHPRVLDARRKFRERQELEICKAFVPQHQAVLAHNLATILPGDLDYTFFCNSGAEANEGALKIATLFQRDKGKDSILYTDLGYHGKTFGTMSVSGPASTPYSELFKGLDGCIQVPWGNTEALLEAIRGRTSWQRNDIACMILEPIKGDLALRPPDGYLEELGRICRKHDILLIFDEIYTGFGRTGEWFGFQHYDVLPDVVTYSKSLGGGVASIAAYTVRSEVFRKTYASPTKCAIHSSTLGGMGSECATAIEALNVMKDEAFPERSAELGEYMLERMKALQERHPSLLKDARAIGLMGIFETAHATEVLDVDALRRLPGTAWIDDRLEGLVPALIVSELLKRHDCLTFTGGREDLILVNPALVVTREQIDDFLGALDDVLSTGIVKLAAGLASNLTPW